MGGVGGRDVAAGGDLVPQEDPGVGDAVGPDREVIDAVAVQVSGVEGLPEVPARQRSDDGGVGVRDVDLGAVIGGLQGGAEEDIDATGRVLLRILRRAEGDIRHAVTVEVAHRHGAAEPLDRPDESDPRLLQGRPLGRRGGVVVIDRGRVVVVVDRGRVVVVVCHGGRGVVVVGGAGGQEGHGEQQGHEAHRQ